MKFFSHRWRFLLLICAAGFSLWCTNDLIRENDPAAVLAGSLDIVTGKVQSWQNYYQYDKYYLSYWFGAGIVQLHRHCLPGIPFLTVANMTAGILFWLAVSGFVLSFRKKFPAVVLLLFLTSPAILLNTLYFNNHLLSSAFLLAGAAFFLSGSRRRQRLSWILCFIAVGIRADALLLLPLLAWLKIPVKKAADVFSALKSPRRNFKELLCVVPSAGLVFSGAAAVILGQFLCDTPDRFIDLFFNWKVVAGFSLFGFGAAGLLYLLCLLSFLSEFRRTASPCGRVWIAAGFLSVLLPVCFFLPQLHSPRYFWRGCEVLLLLAAARPLPEFLHRRWVKSSLIGAAVLPLAIGVQVLPGTIPVPAVSKTELFPSADGACPMGGYVPFMLRLRNAAEHPVDHHQLIWKTLHDAELQFLEDGKLPVLWTPMFSYFMLEAALRGGQAEQIFPEQWPAEKLVYTDSRSFMRKPFSSSSAEMIFSRPAQFISPEIQGVGILAIGSGDHTWGEQTRFLNDFFNGAEYRLPEVPSPQFRGRQRVWFSNKSFPDAQSSSAGSLFFSTDEVPFAENLQYAEAVFPDWLSPETFR
ncbi:MAG: hypothetical protein WC959_04490 [Kiritimatiellales bacterium]